MFGLASCTSNGPLHRRGTGQWDPKNLDFKLSEQPDWYNTLANLDTGVIETPFDKFGNYRHRTPPKAITDIPDPTAPNPEPTPAPYIEKDKVSTTSTTSSDGNFKIFELNFKDVYYECCNLNCSYIVAEGNMGAMGTVATELETVFDSNSEPDLADPLTTSLSATPPSPTTVTAGPQLVVPSRIKYEKYKDYFLHVPTRKIQKTFKNTTQMASNVIAGWKAIHADPQVSFPSAQCLLSP